MNEVCCPNCGFRGGFRGFGVVAPWISELSDEAVGKGTELHSCSKCSLGFFSHRFSPKELDAIYSKYRTDLFFTVRHRWEPWYGNSVNDAFTDPKYAASEVEIRREFTERALKNSGVDLCSLRGCVDFGGDQGQFIPSGVAPPHYIIEKNASAKQAGFGVIFVDDFGVIKDEIDLVMSCYVLEHLTELSNVAEEMCSRLSPTGLLHFEVPLDSFRTSWFHKTNTYRRFLALAVKHRTVFVLLDFITGAYRQVFKRVPWFGIIKQSEHVNYFNSKSLRSFAEIHGLEVLFMSEPDTKYKVGRIFQGRLACVARPSAK